MKCYNSYSLVIKDKKSTDSNLEQLIKSLNRKESLSASSHKSNPDPDLCMDLALLKASISVATKILHQQAILLSDACDMCNKHLQHLLGKQVEGISIKKKHITQPSNHYPARTFALPSKESQNRENSFS